MFNADDANRLLERTKARTMLKGRKKWHLKDTLEMKKVENKIKRCCKKEDRELVLNSPLSFRVWRKLLDNGYKVLVQSVDGKDIGAVIKW